MNVTIAHLVAVAAASLLLVPVVDADEGRALPSLSVHNYTALKDAIAGACSAVPDDEKEVIFVNASAQWLATASDLIENPPTDTCLNSTDDLNNCIERLTTAHAYLNHAVNLAQGCLADEGYDVESITTFKEASTDMLQELKVKAIKIAAKGIIQHLRSLPLRDNDMSKWEDHDTFLYLESLISKAHMASSNVEQLYGLVEGYEKNIPLELRDDLERAQAAVNDASKRLKRCSVMLDMLKDKAADAGFPDERYGKVLKKTQELEDTIKLTQTFLGKLKPLMGPEDGELNFKEEVQIGDDLQVQLYRWSLSGSIPTIHGLIQDPDEDKDLTVIRAEYSQVLLPLFKKLDDIGYGPQSPKEATRYAKQLATMKEQVVAVLKSIDTCKSEGSLELFRELVEDDFYSCRLLAAIKAVDYLVRHQEIFPEVPERETDEYVATYLKRMNKLFGDSSAHVRILERLAALSGFKNAPFDTTLPQSFAQWLSIVREDIEKYRQTVAQFEEILKDIEQEAKNEDRVLFEFPTPMTTFGNIKKKLGTLKRALDIVSNLAASLRVEDNDFPTDSGVLYEKLESPPYDTPSVEDALEAICVPVPRQSAVQVFRMAQKEHLPDYEYEEEPELLEMQSKKERREGLLRQVNDCEADNETVKAFRSKLEAELWEIRNNAFDEFMGRLASGASEILEGVPNKEGKSLRERFVALKAIIARAHKVVQRMLSFATLADIYSSLGDVELFDGFSKEENKDYYLDVNQRIKSLVEFAEQSSTDLSQLKAENWEIRNLLSGVSSRDCDELEKKLEEFRRILEYFGEELRKKLDKAGWKPVVAPSDGPLIDEVKKEDPAAKEDDNPIDLDILFDASSNKENDPAGEANEPPVDTSSSDGEDPSTGSGLGNDEESVDSTFQQDGGFDIEEEVKIEDKLEGQLYRGPRFWGTPSPTIHKLIQEQCKVEGQADETSVEAINEKYRQLLSQLVEDLNSADVDLQSSRKATRYLNKLARVKQEIVKVLRTLDTCISEGGLDSFRELVEDDFYSCRLLAAVKAVDYLVRHQEIFPEVPERGDYEHVSTYLKRMDKILGDSSAHVRILERLAALSGFKNAPFATALPRRFAHWLSIVRDDMERYRQAVARFEGILEGIEQEANSEDMVPFEFSTPITTFGNIKEKLNALKGALNLVRDIASALSIRPEDETATQGVLSRQLMPVPAYVIPSLAEALEDLRASSPSESDIEAFRIALDDNLHQVSLEISALQHADDDEARALLPRLHDHKKHLEQVRAEMASLAENNSSLEAFSSTLDSGIQNLRKAAFEKAVDRLSLDPESILGAIPESKWLYSSQAKLELLDFRIVLALEASRVVESLLCLADLASLEPDDEIFDGFFSDSGKDRYVEISRNIQSLLASAKTYSDTANNLKQQSSGLRRLWTPWSQPKHAEFSSKLAELTTILEDCATQLSAKGTAVGWDPVMAPSDEPPMAEVKKEPPGEEDGNSLDLDILFNASSVDESHPTGKATEPPVGTSSSEDGDDTRGTQVPTPSPVPSEEEDIVIESVPTTEEEKKGKEAIELTDNFYATLLGKPPLPNVPEAPNEAHSSTSIQEPPSTNSPAALSTDNIPPSVKPKTISAVVPTPNEPTSNPERLETSVQPLISTSSRRLERGWPTFPRLSTTGSSSNASSPSGSKVVTPQIMFRITGENCERVNLDHNLGSARQQFKQTLWSNKQGTSAEPLDDVGLTNVFNPPLNNQQLTTYRPPGPTQLSTDVGSKGSNKGMMLLYVVVFVVLVLLGLGLYLVCSIFRARSSPIV